MDLIIGAGISGLTYANFCKHNDYLIIEKDNEIGGYCKTIKQDGFTWDYSGHFFHFQNSEIKKFILDGIDQNTVIEVVKASQILYNKTYIDFPFQKNIHQLNKEELVECLYDLFSKKETLFSNFKEMLFSKFGKAISEKFLIPYNEKLYACDLNELDSEAMGRFFPYANNEDIILNFKNPNNTSYNSLFTYPKGGAIEYVNSLADRLVKDKICLNEELISVDIINKTAITSKRRLKFDNLISSIPIPLLLDKCKILYNKEIYSWNKVLVFNLGFNKKGIDVKNHWVYFPDKNTCFYRIGYYDNIFSDDRMSIYVEIGFKKNDIVDIDYWKNKVIEDLKLNNLISDHELVAIHIVIMNPAYVHINSKSIDDVKEKKAILESENVYSIGRYGSWTYCSIEDNMIEAKNLAKKINR